MQIAIAGESKRAIVEDAAVKIAAVAPEVVAAEAQEHERRAIG
jgi:hypothetical protein